MLADLETCVVMEFSWGGLYSFISCIDNVRMVSKYIGWLVWIGDSLVMGIFEMDFYIPVDIS